MKSILIKKIDNSYFCEKTADYSNADMEALADWFTDDVYDIESWIRWINNNKYDTTESNASWLDKENGNIVIGALIDFMTKDDFDVIGKFAVSMTKQNAIELLNTWAELLKTYPDEIMITEENGVFKMFEVQ